MANRPHAFPTQPRPHQPDPVPATPAPSPWPPAAAPKRGATAPAAVHEPTTLLPSGGGWIPTDPPPV